MTACNDEHTRKGDDSFIIDGYARKGNMHSFLRGVQGKGILIDC